MWCGLVLVWWWAGWLWGSGGGLGSRGCGVAVVVVVVGWCWWYSVVRSFAPLCQNAQLCNRNPPTEPLNSQYGLAPLSPGQAPSLSELSGSHVKSFKFPPIRGGYFSFRQLIQLICGLR